MRPPRIEPIQSSGGAVLPVQQALGREPFQFDRLLKDMHFLRQNASNGARKKPAEPDNDGQVSAQLGIDTMQAKPLAQADVKSEVPGAPASLSATARPRVEPAPMTYVTSIDMSDTVKELWLNSQPGDTTEIHVRFGDHFWPVTELSALRQNSGQFTVQLTAPAYDVRRVETYADQLRKRLASAGIAVESLSITESDTHFRPVAQPSIAVRQFR